MNKSGAASMLIAVEGIWTVYAKLASDTDKLHCIHSRGSRSDKHRRDIAQGGGSGLDVLEKELVNLPLQSSLCVDNSLVLLALLPHSIQPVVHMLQLRQHGSNLAIIGPAHHSISLPRLSIIHRNSKPAVESALHEYQKPSLRFKLHLLA